VPQIDQTILPIVGFGPNSKWATTS